MNTNEIHKNIIIALSVVCLSIAVGLIGIAGLLDYVIIISNASNNTAGIVIAVLLNLVFFVAIIVGAIALTKAFKTIGKLNKGSTHFTRD